MTAFTSLKFELEFSAGVWTDVSTDVVGDVTITQGRPTPYDDVAPGSAIVPLQSYDGKYIPENSAGTYYPNVRTGIRGRISLIKAGVTYTRYTGYATAYDGKFDHDDINGTIVTITFQDALALLDSRVMFDYWTEKYFYGQVRGSGSWGESYRMATNMTTGGPGDVLTSGTAGTWGTFTAAGSVNSNGNTFSSATDTKTASEGTVMWGANGNASSPPTAWVEMNGNNRTTPKDIAVGIYIGPQWTVFSVPNPNSDVIQLINSGGNYVVYFMWDGALAGMYLYTGAGALVVKTALNTPQTHHVLQFRQNAGTATSTDWIIDGATITTVAALDIRNTTQIGIGGVQWLGSDFMYSLGFRGTTPSATELGQGTVTASALLTTFTSAVSDVPATLTVSGSDTARSVIPGYWSGLTGLGVARLIERSNGGIVWTRTDGTILLLQPDVLAPLAPLATIGTESEGYGSPQLLLSDDTRPTRVTVNYGTNSIIATDTDAEAVAPAGRRKDETLTTIASTATQARSLGWSRMMHLSRVRFSRITLDLMSANTDLTSTVLSTSGTAGALYPTQRLRLTVPTALFGVSTKDVLTYGWTETYSQTRATIDFDCIPAAIATVTGGTCVGVTTTGTVIVTTDAVFPTNSDAYPLDMDWAGERITVSAPGGATSPQAFTCTARGVAGGTAAAAHIAGTSIDAWLAGA